MPAHKKLVDQGCSVSGCERKFCALGLCDRHYHQKYKPRREAQRRRTLKSKYGLSTSDYDRMLEQQGGVCAICNREPTERNKAGMVMLNVDHCHATGKVRGLLCPLCNRGLGMFGDCKELLERAAAYLAER